MGLLVSKIGGHGHEIRLGHEQFSNHGQFRTRSDIRFACPPISGRHSALTGADWTVPVFMLSYWFGAVTRNLQNRKCGILFPKYISF